MLSCKSFNTRPSGDVGGRVDFELYEPYLQNCGVSDPQAGTMLSYLRTFLLRAYLLSGSHRDFVFLVTSRALQEQLRSFLHGLIRAIHRQPRHLVQDVLCEDENTAYPLWDSYLVYTLCVRNSSLNLTIQNLHLTLEGAVFILNQPGSDMHENFCSFVCTVSA